MFTVAQIKEAHSKVKSGSDFPDYIQDLKKLGVASYVAFVTDGHTIYYGANDYKATAPAKYDALPIADMADEAQFKADLIAHQAGKTDYATFCRDAAQSGIERWSVCMDEMNCIYFDKAGNKILVEEIPQ